MKISAEEVLNSYTQPARQQMARQRGIAYKGKSRSELIRALAEVLYDPTVIRQALNGLSATERALLDQLILAGGEARTEQVRAILEHGGQVIKRPPPSRWGSYRDSKGSPWATNSSRFEDQVARLGVLGLAYAADGPYHGPLELSTLGQRLYIPDAVLSHLPAVSLPAETIGPPPLIHPADPTAMLYDLYVLLSTVAETDIPLTKAGLIAKRGLVTLAGALRVREEAAAARTEEDLPRLSLLHALAKQAQLLLPREGTLLLTSAATAYLAQPPEERRGRLLTAYRATPLWCELFHVPGLTVRSPGSRRPAPEQLPRARQRVLAELAELPVERWISIEHLVDRLRRKAHDFLLPRPARRSAYAFGGSGEASSYLGDNPLGWTFDRVGGTATWEQVEGGFIRVLVSQALAWLGLVDLGEAAGNVVAFRLTADGVRLLRGEALPPAPLPAPNVVVQPNFQVFAFEPTSESVLFRLGRVAERVRAEQASEYRISRESIQRALQADWQTGDILRFLEEVSNVPLPQNVRRSIEAWGAEQERIVIRRSAALLQALDAASLDRLYADKSLAGLLGRRLAPTAALVAPANLVMLQQRLLERGQLPAVSEGPADPPQQAYTVRADGRIAFHAPLPSMYVWHALRPFTDEEGGVLRLTRASLRRAARSGLTADNVRDQLEEYARGALPEEVLQLITRWARDWGGVTLGEVLLLRAEQPDTLGDLLADPALAGKLELLPESTHAAIVQPGAKEAVQAALADRGIEWT